MSGGMDVESEDVAWTLERDHWEPQVVVEFVVEGDPASKSRARFDNRGSKTRTFTPAKTRQAEVLCALAAKQAGAGPVDASSSFGLMAVFFTATWQRRDVDNMLKLVSDSLTGLVWNDDSQVTEMSARVVRATADPRTHVQIYKTISQTPETKPCAVCGEPVRSFKSVTYKTCSRACSVIAARPAEWSCRTCGRTEMRTAAQARVVYCGIPCRRADPNPRVRQVPPRTEPYVRPAPEVHNNSGYANGCRCDTCRAARVLHNKERNR